MAAQHDTGNPRRLRSVAILGGGTAGWSVAAQLAQVLRGSTRLVLVESSDIPIVGVGEATIPPIFEYLRNAAVDPLEFIEQTDATFKLAILFRDWLRPGHSYWHPFGSIGLTIDQRPFHHYWWREDLFEGERDLADYAPAIALASAGKLALPPRDGSFPGGGLTGALHFDAGKVAVLLARHAMAQGVERVIGTVSAAERAPDGNLAALILNDDRRVEADLFIDCSGFDGRLIAREMGAGYHDWREWLPCDRAVALPSADIPERTPYTTSTARSAGWQWRIPLRSRIGNGYVYSSAHVDADAAADALLAGLDSAPLADPRHLSFIPGCRSEQWRGNVVAIGLAAGFLEPLESTSIHLIHTAINRLLDYWPDRDFAPSLATSFNAETAREYDHIRDFLLLHYVPNQRHGEPFWDHVRNIALPDSLQAKLALFEDAGRIVSRRRELFADISWFFVAAGMGLKPRRHDPLIDLGDPKALRELMGQLRATMQQYRQAARGHDELLAMMLDPSQPRKPDFSVLATTR